MAVIGIDLGTTNSLAAYWKDGKAQLLSDENGNVLLPSVVGYVEGEGFLVGSQAKERLLTHPDDTTASFKRFMGTSKEYEMGSRTYTPMELSAMVLERIRRNAEYFLKEEIEEAIITVPAYFNDKQRSDTKKAARIAGLKTERLINEPSAAALAYRMRRGEEDKSLLVFDFGGGTLDLSYVECFDNVIEIIAVAGDNHLGGDDIDCLIEAWFVRESGLGEAELGETAGQTRRTEEAVPGDVCKVGKEMPDMVCGNEKKEAGAGGESENKTPDAAEESGKRLHTVAESENKTPDAAEESGKRLHTAAESENKTSDAAEESGRRLQIAAETNKWPSREAEAGLRKLSEEAKCALESLTEAEMKLKVGDKVYSAVLNEEILFDICMPLFVRMKELFLHVLEDADSRVSKIDDLIMVGGSSRLKVVRRFLTELLGKEPVVLGETDKVVALGAGVYAGIRQRKEEIRDMLLTDVCPFTLGIGVAGRVNAAGNILCPMIERNSTLPASHRDRFVTAHDYQKAIDVKIYQGEEYYVDNNVFLGRISIDVPQKPAGMAWIEVQFTYDINGILHVAVISETGERRQVLLSNQSLGEEELAQYAKEMEKVMLPPIQQPENQEILQRLFACYENTTGARRESIAGIIGSFTYRLDSGRKKQVKDAVAEAVAWLELLESQKDMREEMLFDGELKEEELIL